MKAAAQFACIMLLFLSCKKDKLKDDSEILTGRWNWIYTEHSYGWCNNAPQYATITPTAAGKTNAVEFLEKGKLLFFENGELTDKNRVVFEYFEMTGPTEYIFYIKLDNDPEKGISGGGNADTLRIKYPYVEENPDCENYLNFFVRE